ncbi:MAG: hypothetical protein WCI61_08800 [Chloroflexota bacterium]
MILLTMVRPAQALPAGAIPLAAAAAACDCDCEPGCCGPSEGCC